MDSQAKPLSPAHNSCCSTSSPGAAQIFCRLKMLLPPKEANREAQLTKHPTGVPWQFLQQCLSHSTLLPDQPHRPKLALNQSKTPARRTGSHCSERGPSEACSLRHQLKTYLKALACKVAKRARLQRDFGASKPLRPNTAMPSSLPQSLAREELGLKVSETSTCPYLPMLHNASSFSFAFLKYAAPPKPEAPSSHCVPS